MDYYKYNLKLYIKIYIYIYLFKNLNRDYYIKNRRLRI